MAPVSQKKRKLDDRMRSKTSRPKKRIRKQKAYHSSSEDDDASDAGFAPVKLQDSEDDTAPPKPPKENSKPKVDISEDSSTSQSADDSSSSSDEDENFYGDGKSGLREKKKSKRNDPEAFSLSMSKILSTKLSQSARKDPVLSRSREAAEASSAAASDRLEQKAAAKLRAEKKEAMEKGRIKDVLGIDRGITGAVAEEEKRLRKVAQKGVIQLFNAFHAAHIRAEQAAKEERRKGTVGMGNREEKVNEMSKQGFLELIGGKKKGSQAQEA